jgi:hypothetical protein
LKENDMNYLQLNPNTAAGGVDRPVLVPVLPQLDDTASSQTLQARSLRRRLGAMRVRPVDLGLRPFRVY